MKQIFSIFDRKADIKLDPFTSLNSQTAMRDIQIKLATDQNLSDYAADFQLLLVGEWYPDAGIKALPITTVIEVAALKETHGPD